MDHYLSLKYKTPVMITIHHFVTVNGKWKSWSAWGSCGVRCGGGKQQRSRTCVPPQHGGEVCQGEKNEEQDCNEQPCPGKREIFT